MQQPPFPTPLLRTPRTLCLPSEDPLLYLEPADASNYFVPSHLLEQQFTTLPHSPKRSSRPMKEKKVDLSEEPSVSASERPVLTESCKASGISSNLMSSEDPTAILFDLYGKLSDPGLYTLDISLADTQSLCVATTVRQQQLAGALRPHAADCMLSPPYQPMSAELKDFTTSDPAARMRKAGASKHRFNDEERVIDMSVLTESIFPVAEEEEDHHQQKSSPSTKVVNNSPQNPSLSAKNIPKTNTASARKYTRKRTFNELDSKQPPDKSFEGGGELPKDCDEATDMDRLALKRIRNTEAARRSRERKALELQTLKDKLEQVNEECTYWRTRYESKSHAAEQREKELVERVKELEALLARIVTSQVPS